MNDVLNDKVIYETENFVASVPTEPHIPREDGGHLMIRARKRYILSRLDLTQEEAVEVMRVTMLVSEAMIMAMKKRNIIIEKMNYQENGNWAYQRGNNPVFHIHLYGRVKNSKTQTWGEALYFPNKKTGFYDGFEPYNHEDIKEIQNQIHILENNEKYNLKNWNI